MRAVVPSGRKTGGLGPEVPSSAVLGKDVCTSEGIGTNDNDGDATVKSSHGRVCRRERDEV